MPLPEGVLVKKYREGVLEKAFNSPGQTGVHQHKADDC
jgi:hypothetical protein